MFCNAGSDCFSHFHGNEIHYWFLICSLPFSRSSHLWKGELLITVAVTTVVNVTFFGSILLCRKLVVKWDARIANDQG